MSISEQIEKAITDQNGSVRDALNVALAKNEQLEHQLKIATEETRNPTDEGRKAAWNNHRVMRNKRGTYESCPYVIGTDEYKQWHGSYNLTEMSLDG